MGSAGDAYSNLSSISLSSTQLPVINFEAGGHNVAFDKHRERPHEMAQYDKDASGFADSKELYSAKDRERVILDISRYDYASSRDSRIFLLKLLKPSQEQREFLSIQRAGDTKKLLGGENVTLWNCSLMQQVFTQNPRFAPSYFVIT